MKLFFIASSLIIYFSCAAQLKIPSYYKKSEKFNKQLQQIVHEVGLDSTYDADEDGKEKI